MRQMSFESVGIIRPGCPARPAAARFRRAFVRPILTRPPIRATQPWSLLQLNVEAVSYGINIGLPIGKESLTKSKKNFPLELRAKTVLLCLKPQFQIHNPKILTNQQSICNNFRRKQL